MKLRHPRARIRADAFGLVATVKTVPKVGRGDFEKHAEYIANAWRCHRVQVSQPRPGRLIVRGLRTDPLTLPFGADEMPPGVITSPLRVYLGRDEWAADRWLNLPGLTGITVGGLPGFGKTQPRQLAALPARRSARSSSCSSTARAAATTPTGTTARGSGRVTSSTTPRPRSRTPTR